MTTAPVPDEVIGLPSRRRGRSLQWQKQRHASGAHTVGCALGDKANFNNSLRKRQICPFFPPQGKEMYVYTRMCSCPRHSKHQTPEGRGLGTTQPHWLWPPCADSWHPGSTIPLPNACAHPDSRQCSGRSALVPSSVSVTPDPPGEAAEQRGVGESPATSKPGALKPASDPQGPQPPPPCPIH